MTIYQYILMNRIKGLFWGQLVGDALGTRYEFSKAHTVRKIVKADIINNELQIIGGGPYNVKAGQYTDDSELALSLWESLLRNKCVNIRDISKNFYLWYKSKPFDVGIATSNAFSDADTYEKMITNALKYNFDSLSNGSLMKISPLGAAAKLGFCKSNELLSYAKQICGLTNPNPICIDIVKSYIAGIYVALETGDNKKSFNAAYNIATLKITRSLLKAALKTNTKFKLSDGTYCKADGPKMGYIGIAFQNAFFQLMKPNNTFKISMINTILIGGDTDTNACISGALYGACYGVNTIPINWITTITNFDNPRKIDYNILDHNKIFSLLIKTKN